MKKEAYFKSSNLKATAESMLEEIILLRESHQVPLKISSAALLIIDMQDYFLHPSSHAVIPSGPVILDNIERLQDVFLNNHALVIQTRHTNTEDNAGMMAKWWQDGIDPDHRLADIHKRLKHPQVSIIEKHQYDCFWDTPLANMFAANGIRQVVIAGVLTHLCCETTARTAFIRGYEVFFVIDATATYNQAFHRAALMNLAHGFAVPVLCEEITNQAGQSDEP